MKQDRIRHDCSLAAALVLEELIGPHLAGMDPKELFTKVYTATASAIDKFVELRNDRSRRLDPTSRN